MSKRATTRQSAVPLATQPLSATGKAKLEQLQAAIEDIKRRGELPSALAAAGAERKLSSGKASAVGGTPAADQSGLLVSSLGNASASSSSSTITGDAAGSLHLSPAGLEQPTEDGDAKATLDLYKVQQGDDHTPAIFETSELSQQMVTTASTMLDTLLRKWDKWGPRAAIEFNLFIESNSASRQLIDGGLDTSVPQVFNQQSLDLATAWYDFLTSLEEKDIGEALLFFIKETPAYTLTDPEEQREKPVTRALKLIQQLAHNVKSQIDFYNLLATSEVSQQRFNELQKGIADLIGAQTAETTEGDWSRRLREDTGLDETTFAEEYKATTAGLIETALQLPGTSIQVTRIENGEDTRQLIPVSNQPAPVELGYYDAKEKQYKLHQFHAQPSGYQAIYKLSELEKTVNRLLQQHYSGWQALTVVKETLQTQDARQLDFERYRTTLFSARADMNKKIDLRTRELSSSFGLRTSEKAEILSNLKQIITEDSLVILSQLQMQKHPNAQVALMAMQETYKALRLHKQELAVLGMAIKPGRTGWLLFQFLCNYMYLVANQNHHNHPLFSAPSAPAHDEKARAGARKDAELDVDGAEHKKQQQVDPAAAEPALKREESAERDSREADKEKKKAQADGGGEAQSLSSVSASPQQSKGKKTKAAAGKGGPTAQPQAIASPPTGSVTAQPQATSSSSAPKQEPKPAEETGWRKWFGLKPAVPSSEAKKSAGDQPGGAGGDHQQQPPKQEGAAGGGEQPQAPADDAKAKEAAQQQALLLQAQQEAKDKEKERVAAETKQPAGDQAKPAAQPGDAGGDQQQQPPKKEGAAGGGEQPQAPTDDAKAKETAAKAATEAAQRQVEQLKEAKEKEVAAKAAEAAQQQALQLQAQQDAQRKVEEEKAAQEATKLKEKEKEKDKPKEKVSEKKATKPAETPAPTQGAKPPKPATQQPAGGDQPQAPADDAKAKEATAKAAEAAQQQALQLQAQQEAKDKEKVDAEAKKPTVEQPKAVAQPGDADGNHQHQPPKQEGAAGGEDQPQAQADDAKAKEAAAKAATEAAQRQAEEEKAKLKEPEKVVQAAAPKPGAEPPKASAQPQPTGGSVGGKPQQQQPPKLQDSGAQPAQVAAPKQGPAPQRTTSGDKDKKDKGAGAAAQPRRKSLDEAGNSPDKDNKKKEGGGFFSGLSNLLKSSDKPAPAKEDPKKAATGKAGAPNKPDALSTAGASGQPPAGKAGESQPGADNKQETVLPAAGATPVVPQPQADADLPRRPSGDGVRLLGNTPPRIPTPVPGATPGAGNEVDAAASQQQQQVDNGGSLVRSPTH